MKSLSEKLLERKRARFIERIRPAITSWMSKDPFRDFAHKPNSDEAMAMILASRFGAGDPLTEGGDLFWREYLLDELNQLITASREAQLETAVMEDPDTNSVRMCSSQSEPWANLVFIVDVDDKVFEHWARLGVDDFEVVEHDGTIDYVVERESHAFGFQINADTLVPVTEIQARIDEAMWSSKRFAPRASVDSRGRSRFSVGIEIKRAIKQPNPVVLYNSHHTSVAGRIDGAPGLL